MAKKARKANKHMVAEEQRQYDALLEFEPGTSEYGMAYAQWEHSYKNLNEVDDNNGDRKLKWYHIAIGALATLAAPFVYEGALRVAESPYTKDVANKVLGNHMPKPKD